MANITDICSAVNQVLQANPTAIYGPVAETIAQSNPWTTVLPTGTLPANMATQLQSVAQVMPNMGLNMGAPTEQHDEHRRRVFRDDHDQRFGGLHIPPAAQPVLEHANPSLPWL